RRPAQARARARLLRRAAAARGLAVPRSLRAMALGAGAGAAQAEPRARGADPTALVRAGGDRLGRALPRRHASQGAGARLERARAVGAPGVDSPVELAPRADPAGAVGRGDRAGALPVAAVAARVGHVRAGAVGAGVAGHRRGHDRTRLLGQRALPDRAGWPGV